MMGEISEKTKVSFQVAGLASVLVACVLVGKYWGGWESDNQHTAATISRHETDIRDLREQFASMKLSMQKIESGQSEAQKSLDTTVRHTTFLIEKFGQVQVALAERGIIVKGD